jgi:hypothetical protein
MAAKAWTFAPVNALVVEKVRQPYLQGIFHSESRSESIAQVSSFQQSDSLSAWAFTLSANSDAQGLVERLHSKIVGVLEDEPVQDGIAHPCELILVDSLDRHGAAAAEAVGDLFSSQLGRPEISAGLLRLVGRMERYRLEPWATAIVNRAIKHQSTLLREAAVTAIENWEARDLGERLLIDHADPVPWLQEYVEGVIGDLKLGHDRTWPA